MNLLLLSVMEQCDEYSLLSNLISEGTHWRRSLKDTKFVHFYAQHLEILTSVNLVKSDARAVCHLRPSGQGTLAHPILPYVGIAFAATLFFLNFLSEKVDSVHRWGKDLSASAMHQFISVTFFLP